MPRDQEERGDQAGRQGNRGSSERKRQREGDREKIYVAVQHSCSKSPPPPAFPLLKNTARGKINGGAL